MNFCQLRWNPAKTARGFPRLSPTGFSRGLHAEEVFLCPSRYFFPSHSVVVVFRVVDDNLWHIYGIMVSRFSLISSQIYITTDPTTPGTILNCVIRRIDDVNMLCLHNGL
jgi:hypothetical protein